MAGYFLENLIESKKYICDSCKEEKTLDDYPKCGKTKLGYQRYRRFCRACWSKERKAYRKTPAGFFEGLWSNLVSKAKERNLEVEISKEDVINLFDKQGGFCAITGFPMQTTQESGINDYAVSVDRIDSSEGYTLDNIHLVCARVNIMKMNMTQEHLEFWCSKILGDK